MNRTTYFKDAENPFTKSWYASLNRVIDACRDALIENGILLCQHPVPVEQPKWYSKFDEVAFVAKLMDSLPQEDFLFIRIGEDYDDIETRGSYRCNPQRVQITQEIAAD